MSWNFELVAGPYGGTTEGPVWDGEALLFTHIPASRILRYSPKTGETTEYFTGANNTNGLCFDAQGNLYGCQSGGRRIVHFGKDQATITSLPHRLDGKRHNNPNDWRSTSKAASGSPTLSTEPPETRNWTTCPCCGWTLNRPAVGS